MSTTSPTGWRPIWRRRDRGPIIISDERDRLLETGGGLKKARPLLGEDPVWVANIDRVWIEGATPPLEPLADAWDPGRWTPACCWRRRRGAIGFDGPGDAFLERRPAALPAATAAGALRLHRRAHLQARDLPTAAGRAFSLMRCGGL